VGHPPGTIPGPRPAGGQAATSYDKVMAAPVSDRFARDSGLKAVSQLNGPNAYFRAGSVFGTSSVSEGTILHETLHNLGKTDGEIQDAWGLASSGGTSNITDELKEKGCVK
jgi:hypothetical protein